MQLSYAFVLFVASFASSSTGAIPSIHASAQKCVDSHLPFPSGRGRTATCDDIGGSKVKAKVCKKKEKFASHCPKTCNKCEEYKCKDSTKGFFIREGVKKKCKWLNKKSDNEKEQECMKKSVKSTCRDTCGYCVLSSAPPTASPTVNPTTVSPTVDPTTVSPTMNPTTASPTMNPTTVSPTVNPTTTAPTANPTTVSPTMNPSTASPTAKSAAPSVFPTSNPTLKEPCPTDRLGIIETASVEAKTIRDGFGVSVSIASSGKTFTLAIGAPSSDGNDRQDNGLVQVYSLNSQDKWTQMGADMYGSNHGDSFGYSISLSTTGNRLAVSSSDYVRVFDFDFDEGNWIKIGSDILDEFERVVGRVALSGEGNTLAVSRQYNSDNGYNEGKVQVFSLSKEEEWTNVGNNDAMTGSNDNDYFGVTALAISTDGTTVVAGSRYRDYVKVFRLVGGRWSLLGGVINGGSAGEGFGNSVDVSHDGGYVVIGAINTSYEGKDARGRAVVYEIINGKNWEMVGQSLYGENSFDNFGNSVSISDSGKRLAVGGPNNGDDGGHVRVFEYNDNEDSSKRWILIDKAIDGKSRGDQSGYSVALSNDANFVAIGAPASVGDQSGSARVFEMKCKSE